MCCSDATRVFVGGRPSLLIPRNEAHRQPKRHRPLPVVSMLPLALSGRIASEFGGENPALKIRPISAGHGRCARRDSIECAHTSSAECEVVDDVPAAACRSGAVRLSREPCPVLRAHTETDDHDAASTVAAVTTPVAPSLSGPRRLANGVRGRTELASVIISCLPCILVRPATHKELTASQRDLNSIPERTKTHIHLSSTSLLARNHPVARTRPSSLADHRRSPRNAQASNSLQLALNNNNNNRCNRPYSRPYTP
ncbi:hypothetical protein PSPO01_08975 [Paraphaeosphaeria sporulosa]